MKRAHFRHGTADAGPPGMHMGHGPSMTCSACPLRRLLTQRPHFGRGSRFKSSAFTATRRRARHREGRDLGPKHQPEGRLEHAGRDRYRHRVVADGPSGAPEPFQRQSSRWPGTSHRRGAPPRRPSHPRAHRDGEPRSTRAARAGGSSSGSGVHVVAHPHKPITRHRVPLIRWRISRARR
jgi:hypothetical protein